MEVGYSAGLQLAVLSPQKAVAGEGREGPLERKLSQAASHRVSVIASLRDEDAVIVFHSLASCSRGLGRWTLMFTLLVGEVGREC